MLVAGAGTGPVPGFGEKVETLVTKHSRKTSRHEIKEQYILYSYTDTESEKCTHIKYEGRNTVTSAETLERISLLLL